MVVTGTTLNVIVGGNLETQKKYILASDLHTAHPSYIRIEVQF